MVKVKILSLIIISVFPFLLKASKIIVISPVGLKSVFHAMKPMVMRLADRGHNITAVTSFPLPKHPNITAMLIKDPNDYGKIESSTFEDPQSIHFFLESVHLNIARNLFSNKKFQNLLLSDSEFDLVLSNNLPYVLSLAVVDYRFRALSVNLWNHPSAAHAYWLTGNNFNPAFQPEVKTQFDDNMTFWERIYNVYVTIISLWLTYRSSLPQHEEMLDSFVETLPFLKERPPLTELIANTSLMILPSHPTTDYLTQHSPNIKHIAGLTLQEKSQLPELFKKVINNAPEGVIVVSWSTVIFGKKIINRKMAMLSAFGTLKQKIIWKEKFPSSVSIPPNVFVKEWLPLQDILANNNTVLFMSHGGLSSVTEATCYGVPMIITPFFSDQFKNANRVIKDNAGLLLLSENITVKSVRWAIEEIMNKPMYKQSALKRSALFRDRIVSPLDEAIFWIEYVLKYGNILIAATAHLSIFKTLLLDILFAVIGLILVLYLQFKICFGFRNKTINSRK